MSNIEVTNRYPLNMRCVPSELIPFASLLFPNTLHAVRLLEENGAIGNNGDKVASVEEH